MKQLKKIKSYIGLLLICSFMLQAAAPLAAAIQSTTSTPNADFYHSCQMPHHLIMDDTLTHSICVLAEDALQTDLYDQLPKALQRCYLQIKMESDLAIDDVIEALPTVLEYAFAQAHEAQDSQTLRKTSDSQSLLSLLMLVKQQMMYLPEMHYKRAIIKTVADARQKIKYTDEIAHAINEIIDNTSLPTRAPSDECCTTLEEEIAHNLTEIIDTRTMLEETINALEVSLTECCTQLHADMLTTHTTITEALDNLCAPTALTQNSAVGGFLILTQPGNYTFCEDITAMLSISGSHISVNMNHRKLTGIISISGSNVILSEGYIEPATPIDANDAAQAAITIAEGSENTFILNIAITCANSIGVDAGNNGINGRSGIYNAGLKTTIADCSLQTGAGAPGQNAQVSPSLPSGNGGSGGSGIISTTDGIQIVRTLIITGNGSNGGSTRFGLTNLHTAGNGGNSGTGIALLSETFRYQISQEIPPIPSFIFDSTIVTGDAGNAGNSCCSDGGNGGTSGDGILNNSIITEIKQSTIRTGNGGTGGRGERDNGGTGGNSGNAITTHGTYIADVILSTGNAGRGGDGGNGGNGGTAGSGIFIEDACESQLHTIVVDHTGIGGNGGDSLQAIMPGNGGNGGNGGDGVSIMSNAKNTEVRYSTFSNTGLGGIGGSAIDGGNAGTNGTAGRAVTDLNSDTCSWDPLCTATTFAPSAIFENFAYGIANTSIRYLINGKNEESGIASNLSCNTLDNVYLDCNVNVVFGGSETSMVASFLDTITGCCANLHAELLSTQTIATALPTELNLQVAELLETITTCCEQFIQNIESCCSELDAALLNTQTTISRQTSDLIVTITDCCESLYEEILETNISLENQIADVTSQASTSLNDLLASMTECCTSLESTLTSCCAILAENSAELLPTITHHSEPLIDAINECCQMLHEQIETLQTTIVNELELIEKCDFIVLNSNPSAHPNVHVITAPITTPGVYCVGEDLVGTFSINTSGVTILFYNFTLTAPTGGTGIVSNNNSYITIEGGAIAGAQTAIDIEHGMDIHVCNMTFTSNAQGIALNNNQDFSIRNCQFINYTDASITLENSNNGNITECQIFNNNSTTPLESLTLINTVTCNQLVFDNIIMTENSNTSTLIGINAFATNNSQFSTLYVTNNSTSAMLEGLYLENCDNNNLTNCNINENSIVSNSNNTIFIGIEVTASLSDSSQNNTLQNCSVNENINTISGSHVSNFFAGINVAGALNGNIIPDAVCNNCSLINCTVNSNTTHSNGFFNINYFYGINLSGAINGGTVGNSVGTDCSIINTIVSNNICNAQGSGGFGNIAFTGINLAGIIGSGTILNNVGTNCSIINCTTNGNNTTANTSLCAGINVSGILGFDNSAIGTNCGSNCSITNCAVHSNTNASIAAFTAINMGGIVTNASSGCTIESNSCSSSLINNCTITNNSNYTCFSGINLASIINIESSSGSPTINNNICANCSINNCTISANNNLNSVFELSFFGISLGSILNVGIIGTDNCTNCSITECNISNNAISTSSDFAYLVGINLSGIFAGGSTNTGNCAGCTLANCTVNNNSCSNSTGNPALIGVNLAGSIGGSKAGDDCNNVVLENIAIYENMLTGSSGSNQLLGINANGTSGTSNGGCNNINSLRCLIKDNVISNAGSFIGVLVNGTGTTGLSGGCNNMSFSSYEVTNNMGIQSSDAYQFLGNPNGGTGGACNNDFIGCSAQSNSAAAGNCNGFDISEVARCIWLNCTSLSNTSTGFLLTDVIDSYINGCKALSNGGDGFNFAGSTSNIAITGNQALKNVANGFDYTQTTALCYSANNIAQNNGSTGFNDNTNNTFAFNFAQGNGYSNYSGVTNTSIQSLSMPATNPFANTTP